MIRLVNHSSTGTATKIPAEMRPLVYMIFPSFILAYKSASFNLMYLLQTLFSEYDLLNFAYESTNPLLRAGNPDVLFPIITSLFFFLSFSVAIILSFKNRQTSVVAFILLCAGLLSRVILAFSPTYWSIHFSSKMYFYYSFLAISLLLYQEIRQEATKTNDIFRYSNLLHFYRSIAYHFLSCKLLVTTSSPVPAIFKKLTENFLFLFW